MHLIIPNWMKSLSHITVSHDSRAITFLVLIAAIILLSFVINKILMVSIGGIYRVFVAPGVIVHEMSHAMGCLLTGAKVSSVNVFKKDGGEVRHLPPRIPIIGQIIISLAPFIVGAIVIYLLAKAVGVKTTELGSQTQFARSPVASIWEMVKTIDFRSIRSWLSLYLITTVAVTMTPSTQDLRNIVASVLAIILMVFLVVRYLGVNIPVDALIRPEFLAILGTCVIILIGCLFFSIVVSVVAGIFRR